MTVAVRDPRPDDEAAWRRLFAGYVAFYEAEVAEAVVARTWARILDPASPIFSRLAERDGRVVGFVNCVLHEGTWATAPLCYLEDLFVDPDVRGGGVGRALIEDVLARARANGWDRVYWQTRETNAIARRLYDSFAPWSGFIVYQPPLG